MVRKLLVLLSDLFLISDELDGYADKQSGTNEREVRK